MHDDLFEKLLLVIFGWALGLLAPAITNAIKAARENAAGRQAIRSELRDVAHKLAYAHDAIKRHLGESTRDDFVWLKKHLEGHSTFEDSTTVLLFVNTALQATDVELAALVTRGKANAEAGLEIQKYAVPLLDSRVSAIWSFDSALQRKLLEIRSCLSLTDRMADKADKYLEKTFSEMTPENRRRIEENYQATLRQYAKTARRIVDLVDTIDRE